MYILCDSSVMQPLYNLDKHTSKPSNCQGGGGGGVILIQILIIQK